MAWFVYNTGQERNMKMNTIKMRKKDVSVGSLVRVTRLWWKEFVECGVGGFSA